MPRYIDADKAVYESYLQDWYQHSVSDKVAPVWTNEHIKELYGDFILIPNDTPTADVAPVVHCLDCDAYDRETGYCEFHDEEFVELFYCAAGEEHKIHPCPNCGAKM